MIFATTLWASKCSISLSLSLSLSLTLPLSLSLTLAHSLFPVLLMRGPARYFFQHHNATLFEAVAVAISVPSDRSAVRRTIEESVGEFHDFSNLTDCDLGIHSHTPPVSVVVAVVSLLSVCIGWPPAMGLKSLRLDVVVDLTGWLRCGFSP